MGVRLVGNSEIESSVCGTGTARAYDLAGRRTGVGGSFARTNVPQAASPATYNVNNQLTQWKDATLTYDANGNLTSDGSFAFWIFLLEGSDTWNARNQLVAISGGASASFQYDPFGRRVSKTIGGTTQYLYDGANPVQEISGSSASANLLAGGVDEYFQRTDSAGARNFLTDALGSTLALADSTGLYFYRARYYSPNLQRFLAEDPLRFAANSANFYELAYDNPTNLIDPSGLQPINSFYGPALAWFAVQSPCTQARIGQGLEGLLNLGIGTGKVAGGVGLTAGTSGLGVAFGAYLVGSGLVANIGGGTLQVAGAIEGDIEGGETGEETMAAIGSFFGWPGLIATRGNVHAAATLSRFEPSDALFVPTLGLEEWPSAAEGADTLLNLGELAGSASKRKDPCKESMPHRK